MKLPQKFHLTSGHSQTTKYSEFPLLQLIDCIVDYGDRRALREIHNRPLFVINSNMYLPLVAYLDRRREFSVGKLSNSQNTTEISEMAYDLSLRKFSELPDENNEKDDLKLKLGSTDCRLYFNAIRTTIKNSYQTDPPSGELEREARAAKMMQRYVNRHFRFSIYEALRKADRFWTRYFWKVKDAQVCVKLPVFLTGRKRREWLEKNIESPDPKSPGEAERIQKIINRNFAKERYSPFDGDEADPSFDIETIFWSKIDEYYGIMLSKIVAREKAINIHRQRPKIRNLGKIKLEKMILQIFDDLKGGEYKDVEIARAFHLSKATFSRFAGSKWSRNDSQIPDLWLNTAYIISKHAVFKELAEKAGIWERVNSVAIKSAQRM